MTGRTHSEDAKHEVVEEALHVVTTLRDMGRGENVRNSLGGGSNVLTRRALRPTSIRRSPTTAGWLNTPCALRESCERWETGVDARRGAGG